jgi:hypothetical protein
MITSKPLDPCVHCGAKSSTTVCVLFAKSKKDDMFVLTGDGIVCGTCYEESYR